MSVRRAQDERLEGTPDGNTAITGVMDVPDAPTIGTASDAGDGTTASVTFTAAATGGTPSSYSVTSSPGNITGTGASSPVTVTGLTAGTAYTFTVTATSSGGTGAASAASNSLTLAVPSNFESIATVNLSAGGTTYIEFTSIPSTYTHLQVRGITKNSEFYSASAPILITFNGDSNTNYTYHNLYVGAATPYSGGGGNQTYFTLFDFPRSYTGRENMFGPFILDILDYKNTNKHKTARGLAGMTTNGQDGIYIGMMSSVWRSTNAITSIKITSYYLNHSQYSHFALYGIK